MHDDGLDAEREALNAAVDALLAGAPLEAVAARLSAELRPLLDAGDRLVRHRPSGDAPRPGFLIGLGDQLRTDLRLALVDPTVGDAVTAGDGATTAGDAFARPERPPQPAQASAFRPKGWWSIALAGVLFGFLAGLVVRSGEAQPGQPLYGVKRGFERVELKAAPDTVARVGSRLDQAWRRLGELQLAVDGGRWSDAQVRGLMDDLMAAYDDALRMAAGTGGDARALRRARADADAAASELDRLAAGFGPPLRAVVAAASDRLRLRIAAAPIPPATAAPDAELPRAVLGGERIVIAPSRPIPEPGQAPPTPAPTAPSNPPTAEPTQAPSPAPTPPPTATVMPGSPTVAPTGTPAPGDPTAVAPPGPATQLPPPTVTPNAPWPTTAVLPPTAVGAPPTAAVATATSMPRVATGSPSPTAVATVRATPSVPSPATATATPRPEATQTPMPSATRRGPEPPPTISAPTTTPAGDPPTPKPPPTDPANPTSTAPPAATPTVGNPGARPGQFPPRSP